MRHKMDRGLPRRDLLRGILGSAAGSALLAIAGCAAPRPTRSAPADAPPTAAPTMAPSPSSTPPGETATPTVGPQATAPAAPTAGPTAAIPQASPSSQPSPSPSAQTTLRLATNHAAVEVPWFRKVLDDFARANPTYRVEQSNVTARYLEQVASWAADGKLPDVVFVRSVHAAAWAYKRWIATIDSLVLRDAPALDLADFHAPQVEELKLDGKWLLLPYEYSGQTLYSRSDAYPNAASAPRDDWTWADLAAAARGATRKDPTSARWGFAWAADSGALAGLWLAEAGAFRREDGRGISVSTAEHVRTTQWLADLALVDGSSPKPGEAGSRALVAGKLGAEIDDASAAAGYRAAGTKVLATGLPKGAAGRRASYATGSGWGLAQSAKDREAAWKLLRHLSSRDSLEILVALPVRSLPGRASAVPLWQAGVEAMEAVDHSEAIVRAASEGFPHKQAVWWLNYQDAFGELMPPVWSGQKKAAEALPELERRVNAAAARYFA